MGSFINQVFCDLPHGKFTIEEIQKADNELSRHMFVLGSHAIEIEPNTPNHQAIKSMLGIWKKRT